MKAKKVGKLVLGALGADPVNLQVFKCLQCDMTEPCVLVVGAAAIEPTLCPFSSGGVAAEWEEVSP